MGARRRGGTASRRRNHELGQDGNGAAAGGGCDEARRILSRLEDGGGGDLAERLPEQLEPLSWFPLSEAGRRLQSPEPGGLSTVVRSGSVGTGGRGQSMRIGESRIGQARERRWQRPYNALHPAVVELEREAAPVRRRAVRLGLAGAIAFHVVLFLVVFPSYYEERILQIGSSPKVYRLQQVRFQPPPKPRAQPQVVRPEARRVPVPDATPNEPEPVVREQAVERSDLDYAEIGDSVVVPEGPPGPSTGPIQIAGDVKAPRRIHAPDPHYPEEARHARIQGVVILQTVIDTIGNVTDVRVLKGLPSGLTESAVQAVSSWRFEPATLEGKPVAVYYLVTISFSVQ